MVLHPFSARTGVPPGAYGPTVGPKPLTGNHKQSRSSELQYTHCCYMSLLCKFDEKTHNRVPLIVSPSLRGCCVQPVLPVAESRNLVAESSRFWRAAECFRACKSKPAPDTVLLRADNTVALIAGKPALVPPAFRCCSSQRCRLLPDTRLDCKVVLFKWLTHPICLHASCSLDCSFVDESMPEFMRGVHASRNECVVAMSCMKFPSRPALWRFGPHQVSVAEPKRRTA